jgi:hypothetical protein
MMERYLRIREEIYNVANDARSVGLEDERLVRGVNFGNKVRKHTTYLKELNEVTIYMQKRCITLSDCRDALDLLVHNVSQYKETPESKFHMCPFQCIKSAKDSTLAPNATFESAIVKIQKGLTHHLDEAEERTVENLKKSYFAGEEDEDDEDDDEVPHAVDLGMAAQLKRQRTDNQRRNVDQNRGDYINCDNIFGSSAEVERLWSVASYILTTQRQSMTPQLFEAIIFLKTNHEFWDSAWWSMQCSKPEPLQQRLVWRKTSSNSS